MKLIIILGHIITLGIFWQPSLEYLYKYANTPEKIEWYLSYFHYKIDQSDNDEWKSPERFIRDGGGDCEDFAIMVYELLKRNGYKPEIYTIWNPNDDRDYGHALCVYEDKLFTPYKIKAMTLKQYMKEYNYTHWRKYDTRT